MRLPALRSIGGTGAALGLQGAFALAFALTLAVSREAATQGSRADSMGDLAPLLDLGQSGAWSGQVDGPAYVLENTREPEAVRYYFVQAPATQREVKVTIAAGFTPDPNRVTGAGLLYALDEPQRTYYAVLLQPGRTVAVWWHGPRGFERRTAISSSIVRENAANELRVVGRGRRIEVFVNGTSVGSLETDGLDRGAVGVIAVGRGRFRFSDFAATRGGA